MAGPKRKKRTPKIHLRSFCI